MVRIAEPSPQDASDRRRPLGSLLSHDESSDAPSVDRLLSTPAIVILGACLLGAIAIVIIFVALYIIA